MMEEEEDRNEEIKSGILLKREHKFPGTKRWVEKWFSLTGRTLSWYNSKKDKGAKKPKGSTSLAGCIIKKGVDGDSSLFDGSPKSIGCCFTLNQPDSTLYLCAEDEEEMFFWVEALNGAASGTTISKETVLIQEGLKKTGVQEISPDALSFDEEVIGKGASGIVKRGLWLNSTEVAVKVLKNVPEFTDKRDLISFYQEIETLSKLRHNNIVQMYGFCKKENCLCLVTEYVRGGNLAQCLEDESYELDLYLQVELALNIARGMVFLHNQKVIHRDLKPANILIESWEEAKVKVCDFGISKVVKKNEQRPGQSETLGSPQYAAPELGTEHHDNKVDVFSFAIILWEIALRKSPWPELTFGSQFAERYSRRERPEIPHDNPFKEIIEKCWAHNPADRPAFYPPSDNGVYPMLQQLQKDIGLTTKTPSRNKAFTTSGSTQFNKKETSPATGRSQSVVGLHSSSNGGRAGSPMSKGSNPTSPPLKHSTSMSPSIGQPLVQYANNSRTLTNSGASTTSLNSSFPSSPPTLHKSQTNQSSANLSRQQPPAAATGAALAKTDAEARIWKLFANKKYESWETFANVFAGALQTDTTTVQKIKFIFEKDGVVEQSTWESFITWFSPLDPLENMYQTSSGTGDAGSGYDINNVLSICTPNWFHSFLSSADAQKALKGKEEGTFLFRFSTTPGCYALTVSYSNSVGHWRISCEKKPNESPAFFIDGRQYKSLSDIVETHRIGKEPLIIKSPKPGNPTSCFLKIAHGRAVVDGDGGNEYYQNVNIKR